MLHHVPSPALQDQLLAEACRVLKPGGVIAGVDSVPSLMWHIYHVFDTKVPVPPHTLALRLQRAGFVDAKVDTAKGGFRFRARKPG
jgi:ubiquinone/menaquinone biosynthesis C-methylase UbiE